ncbi:CCA tRNA nucleotidyltransferase [Sinanaerobacter sp. ZZT-01]|uniref:CCA tRNA nucleotidyltransferase n=1 Tax=Sinanaerobacter sp. ZZT-01 TaxID=3111540 RepID=UPI002D77FB94|nr:HD domain-containing protein [Sinanaerobacter sp. ZZT-01]WRR94967.1 HD domain-containing protein [Sinanaerobacter sp. ZZT-01]
MDKARRVLEKLALADYEAYLVGGCVRDLLLNKIPKDFDITTNALPECIEEIFSGYRTLRTGIKHGTITVIFEDEPFEITTYRTDGIYSDHRRPDQITFSASLQEDLARRDFTINAMAYNEAEGLVDPYNGKEDLEKGILRCVGDAALRFEEDALRLLRLLRFASELGFHAEEKTEIAAYEKKELLEKVSKERVREECSKLLCGKHAGQVLVKWIKVLGVVLPELLPMEGFQQRNPHHKYDVLCHTAAVVDSIPEKPYLRWTALLHDIGKPWRYTVDKHGIGHFYGHAKESENIAEIILKRLKMDRESISKILLLIRYHDFRIEAKTELVKEWLCKLGKENFEDLLLLKKADLAGQNPLGGKKNRKLEALCAVTRDILERGQCYQLKDLRIDGNDLIENGMQSGEQIGYALHLLLKNVIKGCVVNEKEMLLDFLIKEELL